MFKKKNNKKHKYKVNKKHWSEVDTSSYKLKEKNYKKKKKHFYRIRQMTHQIQLIKKNTNEKFIYFYILLSQETGFFLREGGWSG